MLSPADLQDPPRYRLLLRLEFNQLGEFVAEYYLRRQNWVLWVNYALNLLHIAFVLWLGLRLGLNFAAWMGQLGSGLLILLPLVPLHELLHAAVYRLYGARDVRFGLLPRLGAVYAVAHGFVISARRFVWVALAPCLGINGACLLLALCAPALAFPALLVSLLHLSAVGGDWAMLAFLWEHRSAPVYTYDDADAHVTYFYQEAA